MTKFIACKRRNVAAAYERFLGPSSGVLPQPWHSRTWNGLVNVLTGRYRDGTVRRGAPRAAARR